MKLLVGIASAMAVAVLALPAGGASHPASAMRVDWGDLRPAQQNASDLLLPAAASDFGRTLSDELGGKTVEITGFLLPSDREGSLVYEFMLVPVAGACSHGPQPPPNQIVRVKPEKPFKADGAYQAVTVTGTIQTGFDKAQLFILDGVRVVESGYRIGSALVEAKEGVVPLPASNPSPWKFLNK